MRSNTRNQMTRGTYTEVRRPMQLHIGSFEPAAMQLSYVSMSHITLVVKGVTTEPKRPEKRCLYLRHD